MMDNEATIPSSLASTEAENVDTETADKSTDLATQKLKSQSNNPFRSSTLTYRYHHCNSTKDQMQIGELSIQNFE